MFINNNYVTNVSKHDFDHRMSERRNRTYASIIGRYGAVLHTDGRDVGTPWQQVASLGSGPCGMLVKAWCRDTVVHQSAPDTKATPDTKRHQTQRHQGQHAPCTMHHVPWRPTKLHAAFELFQKYFQDELQLSLIHI